MYARSLQSAIAQHADGLALSSIDVYLLGSGSKRQAVKVIDKRVGGGPAKLADLSLKDGMDIIAEKNIDERGRQRARPLAFDEASKRQKVMLPLQPLGLAWLAAASLELALIP